MIMFSEMCVIICTHSRRSAVFRVIFDLHFVWNYKLTKFIFCVKHTLLFLFALGWTEGGNDTNIEKYWYTWILSMNHQTNLNQTISNTSDYFIRYFALPEFLKTGDGVGVGNWGVSKNTLFAWLLLFLKREKLCVLWYFYHFIAQILLTVLCPRKTNHF